MIIVEGPDGSGKTRLCKELGEEFSLTYMRYQGLSSVSGPDGPGIVEWWDEQIAAQNTHFIYDRCFYVSEVIYQLATPGRPLMVDSATIRDGIARLWTFEPLWIFCTVPWENAIANIGQRNRLAGVDDHQLEKIHWAYPAVMTMWQNSQHESVIQYDYTNGESEKDHVFTRVADHLQRRELLGY